MSFQYWSAFFLVICLVTPAPAGDKPKRADEKSSAKNVYLENVVYGQVHGAGLLADIAYPESKKPLAVILSVHGGRWRGGHRRDASSIKVSQWADLGFF